VQKFVPNAYYKETFFHNMCCDRGENKRERKNNNITIVYHPKVWGVYIEVGATLTML
jgi:hypothetical protein